MSLDFLEPKTLAKFPDPLLIVCATQRCGSTMVLEDMRNSGLLGKPEEYFIPWDPSLPDQDWVFRLESVFRASKSSNGVAAIKVMADQAVNVDRCLSQVDDTLHKRNQILPSFHAFLQRGKFVYIQRRDRLRQAISRVIARRTGINHAVSSAEDDHFAGNLMKGLDTGYAKQVPFDFDAIRQTMIAIEEENLIWEGFFKSWGIKPLRLIYEDYKDDFPGYMQPLFDLAGVDMPTELPQRKMVKLGSNTNEQFAAGYVAELVRRSS